MLLGRAEAIRFSFPLSSQRALSFWCPWHDVVSQDRRERAARLHQGPLVLASHLGEEALHGRVRGREHGEGAE